MHVVNIVDGHYLFSAHAIGAQATCLICKMHYIKIAPMRKEQTVQPEQVDNINALIEISSYPE